MGACSSQAGYGLNAQNQCVICPAGTSSDGTNCLSVSANCYSDVPGATVTCPKQCATGFSSYPGATKCFGYKELKGISFEGSGLSSTSTSDVSTCFSKCAASVDSNGAPNCIGFNYVNNICIFRSVVDKANADPNSIFYIPTPVSNNLVYLSFGNVKVEQSDGSPPVQLQSSSDCGNLCQGQATTQVSWNKETKMCSCPNTNNLVAADGSYDYFIATKCPPGTYKTTNDFSGCLKCPAGTYYDSWGAVGSCRPVRAGCYGPTEGSTSSCPFNCGLGANSLTGQTKCNPAPPGYYNPGQNDYGVLPCPEGQYTSVYGSSSCLPVARDCYSNVKAATTSCPNKCPEYLYSVPGSKTCFQLVLDFYTYRNKNDFKSNTYDFIGRMYADELNVVRAMRSIVSGERNLIFENPSPDGGGFLRFTISGRDTPSATVVNVTWARNCGSCRNMANYKLAPNADGKTYWPDKSIAIYGSMFFKTLGNNPGGIGGGPMELLEIGDKNYPNESYLVSILKGVQSYYFSKYVLVRKTYSTSLSDF